MYDNGSVKAKAVMSANKTHLIYSIITSFMLVMLEGVMIWHCFFRADHIQDVGLVAIIQIPAMLVALVPLTHLPAYKSRKKFVMYFSKIENADMKAIKEKYYICHIDEHGVLFVEKKDAQLYSNWALLYDINSTREVEERIFVE